MWTPALRQRSLNDWRPPPIGRETAVLVLASYLGALFVLGVVGDGWKAWGTFGVAPWTEPFSDMWSITSGWECVRRGIDVVPYNPCDPWGRYANYPDP